MEVNEKEIMSTEKTKKRPGFWHANNGCSVKITSFRAIFDLALKPSPTWSAHLS